MLDHNSDRTSLYYRRPKKFINFFSLNFESTEFEGDRMSSSQKECTLRGTGSMLKNEQGRIRGGFSGILSKHVLNVKSYWLISWPVVTNDSSIIDPWEAETGSKKSHLTCTVQLYKKTYPASLQRSSNVFSHCYCWQTTQKRQWLPVRTKS